MAMFHYSRGVELAANGKLAEAKTAFSEALKVDPQNYASQRCLSVLSDAEKEKVKQQTAVHLFRAIYYFNNNKADDAVREWFAELKAGGDRKAGRTRKVRTAEKRRSR